MVTSEEDEKLLVTPFNGSNRLQTSSPCFHCWAVRLSIWSATLVILPSFSTGVIGTCSAKRRASMSNVLFQRVGTSDNRYSVRFFLSCFWRSQSACEATLLCLKWPTSFLQAPRSLLTLSNSSVWRITVCKRELTSALNRSVLRVWLSHFTCGHHQ